MPSMRDAEANYYRNNANASVMARGTQTAPGAGVAIATIAAGSLPAGVYEVEAITNYGGTADVIDNMELRVAAGSVLVLPVLPIVNGTPVPITCRVVLNGAQALSINAIAAGAVSTVYIARLIARRVSDV